MVSYRVANEVSVGKSIGFPHDEPNPDIKALGFPVGEPNRASSNNISGTLPPSVGALTDLNDLSLFENRISGSLPLELGNLYPLRYLRMQDNHLDANFTKFHTLGNLRQLVTLDLYNNRMTGEVPPSLQNLTCALRLERAHADALRACCC